MAHRVCWRWRDRCPFFVLESGVRRAGIVWRQVEVGIGISVVAGVIAYLAKPLAGSVTVAMVPTAAPPALTFTTTVGVSSVGLTRYR